MTGLAPKLFICGRGENKEDFEQLRDDLDLSEDITIEGYIENSKVPQLINSFDVFCLGSNKESFGVSAIEAMACGIPVVATRTDGFCEVIPDNEAGYIVPVNDPSAMAEKMLLLYHDNSLRERMGRNGIMHVSKYYNWSDNVGLMERYLTEKAIQWNR